jgi:predicted DNA-binding protein with PD1-like motif
MAPSLLRLWKAATAAILLTISLTVVTMQTQAQDVLTGALWTAKKVDSTYVLSIKDRSGVKEALIDFITQNHISAGSITGIGAVNEATLRFFNPATKKYVDKTFKQQMEIANLTGNISTKDGKPYLHVHITLGSSSYSAYAGHLLDAKIRGAGEFYIYPLNAAIARKFSEEAGLNFYDFEAEGPKPKAKSKRQKVEG